MRVDNINDEENKVEFNFVCERFLIMSSYGDFKTAIGPVGSAIKAISESAIIEDKSSLNYLRCIKSE